MWREGSVLVLVFGGSEMELGYQGYMAVNGVLILREGGKEMG